MLFEVSLSSAQRFSHKLKAGEPLSFLASVASTAWSGKLFGRAVKLI